MVARQNRFVLSCYTAYSGKKSMRGDIDSMLDRRARSTYLLVAVWLVLAVRRLVIVFRLNLEVFRRCLVCFGCGFPEKIELHIFVVLAPRTLFYRHLD